MVMLARARIALLVIVLMATGCGRPSAAPATPSTPVSNPLPSASATPAAHASVWGLRMITAAVGWALGLPERVPDGTPIWQAARRPRVVRTTDGGATWPTSCPTWRNPGGPVGPASTTEGLAWVSGL